MTKISFSDEDLTDNDGLFHMANQMMQMSQKLLAYATVHECMRQIEQEKIDRANLEPKPEHYRGPGRPKGSPNKPKSGYNPMDRSGNL